jgi:hypothetical protein
MRSKAVKAGVVEIGKLKDNKVKALSKLKGNTVLLGEAVRQVLDFGMDEDGVRELARKTFDVGGGQKEQLDFLLEERKRRQSEREVLKSPLQLKKKTVLLRMFHGLLSELATTKSLKSIGIEGDKREQCKKEWIELRKLGNKIFS